MQLVLLDIDGTLTDTNEIDSSCFVQALADVYGIREVDTEWAAYPNVTDSALTAHLVENQRGRPPGHDEIIRMQERFHSLLEAAFTDSRELCQAISGGTRFLDWLSNASDRAVAFATGGWRLTARLKLKTAGYHFASIPMASADDAHRRVDICSISVHRSLSQHAVSRFDSIVYFGDGIWDARAAAELGYRFVGVASGRSAELLRDEGAEVVIPDFDGVDHAELLAHLSR